jgi:hypothetical protein
VITTLVVAVLVIYLVERLRPILQRTVDQRDVRSEMEAMPADLKALVMGQSETWAQEDAEKRFHELYASLGSWSRVREYVTGAKRG